MLDLYTAILPEVLISSQEFFGEVSIGLFCIGVHHLVTEAPLAFLISVSLFPSLSHYS